MSKRLNDTIRLFESLLSGGMESIVEQAADEQRPLMEQLQVQQLQSGERADGSKIAPAYTPLTVRLKREKGQPTDRVTLRDSGNLHNSIKAEKYNGAYHMEMKDYKTARLIDKYGAAIEGLQDDNIDKVGRAMVPDIAEGIRKHLKL